MTATDILLAGLILLVPLLVMLVRTELRIACLTGMVKGHDDARAEAERLGLTSVMYDGSFRWKTRSEIADEVIAERRQARADQQREQQERFREQWGNAVSAATQTKYGELANVTVSP